jgi:cell division protease FtsH
VAPVNGEEAMTEKKFHETYSGEEVSVTAAHEAGHALVAWLSPAIESVQGTGWERLPDGTSKASVRFAHRKPATAFTIWEISAISAAGMAAEVITHGRFGTRSCRGDLTAMRDASLHLTKGGKILPVAPWQTSPLDVVPPFERYFRSAIAPLTAAVMRTFFLRAYGRILEHRGAYERLRTALIVKIELTTAEIEAALRMPKG